MINSILINIFTFIGGSISILLVSIFLLQLCNSLWKQCGYNYVFMLWYCKRNNNRTTWRSIRRRYVKVKDWAAYLHYKNQPQSYVSQTKEKPPIKDGDLKLRVLLLETGIKEHKANCPDDGFATDDKLWALVD